MVRYSIPNLRSIVIFTFGIDLNLNEYLSIILIPEAYLWKQVAWDFSSTQCVASPWFLFLVSAFSRYLILGVLEAQGCLSGGTAHCSRNHVVLCVARHSFLQLSSRVQFDSGSIKLLSHNWIDSDCRWMNSTRRCS